MSEPEKPTYQKFKEFYDKHPDLDNGEYYAEFPTGNKSTIRSWKNKASYVEPPSPIPDTASDIYEKDYFNLLCTQTGTNANEFKGVDLKSAIIILKNRAEAQQKIPPKPRPGNTSILPSPKPIGQSTKQSIKPKSSKS